MIQKMSRFIVVNSFVPYALLIHNHLLDLVSQSLWATMRHVWEIICKVKILSYTRFLLKVRPTRNLLVQIVNVV